jgi:hypothetical protein
MATTAVTTSTALRLEQLEPRDVPSTFNTIHTNPITPGLIQANAFQRVFAGDFDADGSADDLFFWLPGTGANRLVRNVGTATPTVTSNPILPASIGGTLTVAVSGDYNGGSAKNDMFFWDPVSGHNVLVLALMGPVVTTDKLSPSTIKGGVYSKLVAGDFNSTSAGTELFFWNPTTGRNRLVADVDGTPTATANPISPATIGNRYKTAVAGDFTALLPGDELFFWDPTTGRNRMVAGLDSIPVAVINTVTPDTIKGIYTTVVAGDLSTTGGTELFFWNPTSGRNLLVSDVSGPPGLTTNPVDPAAIDGNVFSRLTTGAFVDSDTALFFWNPTSGKNWAIDE